METKEYSLRERKHAQTKIALMNAFIKRLERTRFEEISIREICKIVEVSEGTFFNYFSAKIDIIHYYSSLVFLKVFWKAQKESPTGKHLAFIEAIFKNVAVEISNGNIIYPMLSIMIMQKEKPKVAVVSDIEKRFLFPDCPGIENVPIKFIDAILADCLNAAYKNGELPRTTKIDDAQISLMTILGGTVLATRFTNTKDQTYHFMRQLRLLWKGMGVKVRR
ncbi:MAG TPA: TetR/AcrR family transcriptional regulator [Candidatus Omnitrophota bacterium]|nr:TetR/AcrR family transcriptional regulator [Candidatus Omnitrophota bacterium]HPB68589.1 TetR/AcrR family transcriptional regulator [Candidatus Omnitrophota bacterium]HQO57448.1 TetR/AcrR family transcriptional regulator [Candidatus Omnitrophota bacterium]HQP12750.1 TetR/AcrR family transcriptional regulator [Candidatus Omnitrophota bacterium]